VGDSCSNQSLDSGEALAGTGLDAVRRWLVVEVSESWGRKPPKDADLPQDVISWLSDIADHPHGRLQFIRKPGREVHAGREIFVIHTDAGEWEIWRRRVTGWSELLDSPLMECLEDPAAHGFSPHPDPLYLVCTHGRRDPCCALLGMPVYTALERVRPDQTWQSSHTGGHRFAANVVALPLGYSYGRIDADEVGALIAATETGVIHALDKLRGQCAWDRHAQAAEIFLRREDSSLAHRDWTWHATVSSEEHGVKVGLADADGMITWAGVQTTPTGASNEPTCDCGEFKDVMRFDCRVLEA